MKFKIRYYDGDTTMETICKDEYDLKNIIEFMKLRFNKSPESINPIFESEANK